MKHVGEEDGGAPNSNKLKALFFDPANGYGSAQLRQMVDEVLGTQRKVTEYLSRFVETHERRDLQEKTGYGNQKEQITDTLNLLFDIGYDHGTHSPHARFLKAVKALGLDDGKHAGADPEESAEHYYMKFRDLLISTVIHEAEVKRVLDQPRRFS